MEVPLLPPPQVRQEVEGLLGRDADIHFHLETQHVVFLQCVQSDLKKQSTSKNTRRFFLRSLQFQFTSMFADEVQKN